MDKSRESASLSEKLDSMWAARVAKANEWNARLARGEIKPGLLLRLKWATKSALRRGELYEKTFREFEQRWKDCDGQQHASLTWTLNDTFGWYFWTAGFYKVRAPISYDLFLANIRRPYVTDNLRHINANVSAPREGSYTQSDCEPTSNFASDLRVIFVYYPQAIINFAKENAIHERAGEPKSNIARGFAMAIGLFCLTVFASICQHQVSFTIVLNL